MSKLPFYQSPNSTTPRPIPKLRVTGFDGPAEQRQMVASHFAGVIKEFYLRCAHNHSLGIVDQSSRTRETDQYKINYTNIQGQEIVTLTVSASVAEEILKPGDDYWHWALIEVHIPNTNTSTVHGAAMSAERTGPIPREAGLLFEGFAYELGAVDDATGEYVFGDGLDDPIIAYPNNLFGPYVATESESSGVTQVSTLRVDMRKFPRVPFVIELYGGLQMVSNFEEQVVAWSRNAGPDRSTSDDTDHGDVDYPDGWIFGMGAEQKMVYTNLGFEVAPENSSFAPVLAYRTDVYGGDYGGEIEAEWVPAPAPELTTISYGVTSPSSPGAGSMTTGATYHSPSGLLTSIDYYVYSNAGFEGGPNAYTSHTHEEWDITEVTGFVEVFPPDEQRIAEVRGVGGFGWPPWVTSNHDAPTWDWAQWEIENRYPEAIGTARCGDTMIESFDSEGTMIHLGTVQIDPVRKSISFRSSTM